jgi:hypothetical protein
MEAAGIERPKTFRKRIYIRVRFRFSRVRDLKEAASWPEPQPVVFRPAPPGQQCRAILQSFDKHAA